MDQFVFIWPSVTKEYSIKVASVLNDHTFWEYENSLKQLKHLRNRHELIMIGIRGLSLFQVYFAYLSHYQYANSSQPSSSLRKFSVIARIAAFLLIADTLNFNLYYNQSKEIVNGHLNMREEYERQKREREGDPDDIYLIKPEEKQKN